ncbi:hypothetical protein B0H15DRAFT_952990 [Mycena belliarum]|uniref:F-box domain-containing protein n=1 Tax=Mycena belliarum TaxID=1033014 RepID=A0AAD6TW31_9AGAR|nr:hypothetical protein B0H15DRAFT_952990 [Mycena belliae]
MSNPLDLARRTGYPTLEGQLDVRVSSDPATAKLRGVYELLEDTDAEIAGTLAHLQRLEARRKDLLIDLNSIASFMLNLPAELICEIFLHCLPPLCTPPSPRDAPLLLAQVCRHWRSMALSLPALWTHICVPVALKAVGSRVEMPSAVLDLWLERAGPCLLSVSVVLETQAPPPETTQVWWPSNEAFRTLCHNCHRWRELEIVRRLEDFPLFLPKETHWNLPELAKLTLLLAYGGRHPSGYPPGVLSNLMNTPALREVHLMGFTPISLQLPWAQLTTAHVENLLPIEFLETLAHTTHLVDGTFSLWPTQMFHIPATAPAVRLLRLKSLRIIGELCTEIMTYLACPALARFALSFGPGNDLAPLTAFLARSPSIVDLDLDARAAVPLGGLLGVLDALPTTEALALGVHTGLLNTMLPHVLRSTPTLLPRLRRLVVRERVDRYNEPPVDAADVVDMLRTRWAAGLKSFCLVTTHVFHTIHPGFSILAREGMDLELKTHGSGPFLVVYFNSRRQY